MIGRRKLLERTAVGLAALPVLKPAAFAADPPAAGTAPNPTMSEAERNKALITSEHENQQKRDAVPPTLPGAAPPVSREFGSTGTAAIYACYDPPGGVDDPKATVAAIAGWHMQSTAPPIHSYGPFIAEGDTVVEESEVFFHGLDGTMYNNQYCWVRQYKDGKAYAGREYLDFHHAKIILSLHAKWTERELPRSPRRRWRSGHSSIGLPPLTDMETVWPIRQEFNLDPRMLRDVIPPAKPPQRFPDTAEGNKAVVRAMRDAQAKGDAAAVASLHGQGFRHFMCGEGHLGWNHLPVQDLYAPLVKHLDSPIKIRFSPMVAEDGRVVEEMDILAKLDDGTVYNNWHCFVHEIRNGLIVQTREYMDTHHFWLMLARWADWGKTPIPPQRQARRSNLPYIRDSYQWRNPFLKLERWQPLPPTKV